MFGVVFRILLVLNGLLDLIPLGFLPLLMHSKMIDSSAIPPLPVELTVQGLFPSFGEGGIEHRLVLYGFIACGFPRLFAGLGGLFSDGSRMVDFLAVCSYLAEITMFYFEVFVFKTTTLEKAMPAFVLPAVVSAFLLLGMCMEYKFDALYKSAKSDTKRKTK
jgi:hypothetical protein